MLGGHRRAREVEVARPDLAWSIRHACHEAIVVAMKAANASANG